MLGSGGKTSVLLQVRSPVCLWKFFLECSANPATDTEEAPPSTQDRVAR